VQLELEVERGRRRLKETQYLAKSEEEAMQRLIKIYVLIR
jgi:fido (protein-threonine AMPylation protein)